MASPAIENIIKRFDNAEITFIGSYASIETIKYHPNTINSIVLNSSLKSLLKLTNQLSFFDIFISFRGSFKARILKLLVNSEKKYQFNSKKFLNRHQVIKYGDFINQSLDINYSVDSLKIYTETNEKSKTFKILGINPGATYGSAKRWYPAEFAKVACKLSKKYDILIFGKENEQDFANQIELELKKK